MDYRAADFFPHGSFLVFMSGGPDSAAAAYDKLNAGHGVLGVYVQYAPETYPQDTLFHNAARNAQCAWLKKRFQTLFLHYSLDHPMGDDVMQRIFVNEASKPWVHWRETMQWAARLLMSAYPKVTRVTQTPAPIQDRLPADEIDMVYSWVDAFNFELPSFVRDPLTKRMIRESMPQELWDLTLSCLYPTIAGPCGTCVKCKERSAAYD